jgi:hypothetical protein
MQITRGSVFASRLAAQFRSEDYRHAIRLMFTTGGLEPGGATEYTQYAGYLSYSFDHRLAAWSLAGQPFGLSAGGGLSTFVNFTHLKTVDKPTVTFSTDGSGYLSHSINILLRGEYQPAGGHSLAVECSTPAVRLVSRPDNGHGLNARNNDVAANNLKAVTGGRLEFLWSNLVLTCELEYRARVSRQVEVHGSYWFGYASSDRPDQLLSLGMYMNQFLVGFDVLF